MNQKCNNRCKQTGSNLICCFCVFMFIHRTQTSSQNPKLSYGSLIDEARHLSNLKFEVWKKMAALASYCKYHLRMGKYCKIILHAQWRKRHVLGWKWMLMWLCSWVCKCVCDVFYEKYMFITEFTHDVTHFQVSTSNILFNFLYVVESKRDQQELIRCLKVLMKNIPCHAYFIPCDGLTSWPLMAWHQTPDLLTKQK